MDHIKASNVFSNRHFVILPFRPVHPELAQKWWGGLAFDVRHDNARGNLAELFETQPLAIAAVGLAIGAAIAAALPTTETEAEYFGESSEFLKQRASDIAGERATEMGRKVADAVADKARQQGLTPDGLRSASVLAEKTARMAGAASPSQS